MEGFVPAEVNEILGLEALGLNDIDRNWLQT
jgi:hypothetical protein